MSSRAFSGHTAHPSTPGHAGLVNAYTASQAVSVVSQDQTQPYATVRRRPNREQGMALEVLGHAIEYLVDTHLCAAPRLTLDADQPDQQAIQILMRLNRSVFSECAEIKPLTTRLLQWLHLRH